VRSLSLRPGGLLTPQEVALSMGFSSFGFPPGCHPATGFLALPPGGTVSHWTHQPLLVAPLSSAARLRRLRRPRPLQLIVGQRLHAATELSRGEVSHAMTIFSSTTRA
jgi:hypothetical protein